MAENEREGAQHGSVSDLLELFRGQSSGGGDGMRRNDSEIAFQDFLKRIPSSSNLAYLSSGGPSMGNLLDAATGGNTTKEGLQGAGSEQAAGQQPNQAGGAGQQQKEQQNGGGMKPSGLMSGMPRVSSLDFLARLVCSQPVPASGNSGPGAQQPPQGALPTNGTITTSSGTPGAPGVKLEPGSTGLQQESFAGAPAPLSIPGMNPIDLQGLHFSSGINPSASLQGFPHSHAHGSIPPPLSQGLHIPGGNGLSALSPGLQMPSNTSSSIPSLSQGLHIPNISGLNNTMPGGLPPGAGLDLGPLQNLNNIHLPPPHHHPHAPPNNPTQAATAALQLQGSLAQAGSAPPGPLLHHSLDTSAHTPLHHPQHPQQQPQPQQPATTGKRGRQRQHPAASQQPARGGASSARRSQPSSTADTGTMSDESDGADNLKGVKGGPNTKRARRMLSNRESARRSRKRKQEHLGKLEDQINSLQDGKRQLQENNALLNQQLSSVNDHNKRLQTENERLRDELQFLRTEIQGQRKDGNKR